MENSEDDYAYLTTKVLQIKNFPSDMTPLSVVLIGPSDFKEALDRKYLEQFLSEEINFPVTVYKLTPVGMNLWERICVLDNIRDKLWGIVVLQVSISNLSLGREHLKDDTSQHSRAALYCPTFVEEMARIGKKSPQWKYNYFIDFKRFFIARLPFFFLNITTGAPQYWKEFGTWGEQGEWREPTPDQWKKIVSRRVHRLKAYDTRHEENFQLYTRLIKHFQKNNFAQIVFLEGLINPKTKSSILSTPEIKKISEKYLTDMQEFSKKMQVSYWDLGEVVNFRASDFIDHVHIREVAARQRYTKALAIQLKDILLKLRQVKEKHP